MQERQLVFQAQHLVLELLVLGRQLGHRVLQELELGFAVAQVGVTGAVLAGSVGCTLGSLGAGLGLGRAATAARSSRPR